MFPWLIRVCALLQLSVNKASKDLFLEYFRLEVSAWQKMLERAKVLGIDTEALVSARTERERVCVGGEEGEG